MPKFQPIRTTGTKGGENLRVVWLALVGLTLLSVLIGESGQPSVIGTVFVCLVVVLKGRWVIRDFMNLRNAAPLPRRVVTGYFLVMTLMVGGAVSYLQFTAIP